MAIVWQKEVGGTLYQVRQAGNSTRLYTDGVFHSQYNPSHPVTGSVWDLLMLPAFFKPQGSIKRVLVLGVGGGAVLQLLHRYVQPREIIGIELVPSHIHIARKYFGINKQIARLIRADAIKWLATYQGPPFDMIIDDLFGEENGEGVRAIPLSSRWMATLNRHLNRDGILVVNLLDRKSLLTSAYFTNQRVANHYASVFTLTLPQLYNLVAVFLKTPSSSKVLRKRINSVPGLTTGYLRSKLPFRISQIT